MELTFCKYYKGEEKCPYDYGSVKGIFWDFEKMYWNRVEEAGKYPFNHDMFEDMAREYISNNKDKDNFLTSDAPIEQKGFVLFAEEMLRKWMPHHVNYVFEY